MKRSVCWLAVILMICSVGSIRPASAAQAEQGYWKLEYTAFNEENSVSDEYIRQNCSYIKDHRYEISEGSASMSTTVSFGYDDSTTSSADFTFDLPDAISPGATFEVPLTVTDTSPEADSLERIHIVELMSCEIYGDEESFFERQYFQPYGGTGQETIIMTAPDRMSQDQSFRVYVSTKADYAGGPMSIYYQYVYVDGAAPETLLLRGIVRSVEGNPMPWMTLRAGICVDPEEGREAFDAGTYEDEAEWTAGRTDLNGYYALEIPIPDGAGDIVGVILEGSLTCALDEAATKAAYIIRDDADSLSSGDTMRLATWLEVDLTAAGRSAASAEPATVFSFLNFQNLLLSGGWSLNDYGQPDPAYVFLNRGVTVALTDKRTGAKRNVALSAERRMADASALYTAAHDAWFFGGVTLGEADSLSAATILINLRSAEAETISSSHFVRDSAPTINLANIDSMNDDASRGVLLHEFGHAFDSLTNGGPLRAVKGYAPGDINHGGYMNASSSDSYKEGFATAYACMVQLYGGYPNPETLDWICLEYPYHYVAWGRDGLEEEFAIAALLYQAQFIFRDTLGYWAVLKPDRANFAEYYQAMISALPANQAAAVRGQAIELGLYKMPYAGNGAYDPGEPFLDLNQNNVRDAAADPFTDANGNGVLDPGEFYTDANHNGTYDTVEPYGDLIFAVDANGRITDQPVNGLDKDALVVGEVGDFDRSTRKSLVQPADGYLAIEGADVSYVLVTVSPADGTPHKELRAVAAGSVFLIQPGLYGSGTVRVEIPGGAVIYEGTIEQLNEAGESLAPGSPLAVAEVSENDLAPGGAYPVATYGSVDATGLLEPQALNAQQIEEILSAPAEQPDGGAAEMPEWDTAGDGPEDSGEPAAADLGEVLWTNADGGEMQAGARDYYVMFDLARDCVVTSITTYHGADGGAEPGVLMLYAEGGGEYGPYQTVGIRGPDGTETTYWCAQTGELSLSAGRYAIADSDQSTWLCSEASGFAGIAEIRGYEAQTQGNPFADPTAAPEGEAGEDRGENAWEANAGLWLCEPLEDDSQILLYVIPDDSIELYSCFYRGEGDGSVECLLDPDWECTGSKCCTYEISADQLTIYAEDASATALSFHMPDDDTIELTNGHGYTFTFHRATPEQEASWLGWMWR